VDIAQRLRQLEVFGHFSSEQIEQLARCTSRVRYPQDAVVIQEGDHTLDAYVIDSGLVAIQRSTPYGLFSLAQLGAGELFGETSFIDQIARSSDALVREPACLLPLNSVALSTVTERDPKFTLALYWAFWRSLSRKLRQANEHLAGFFAGGGAAPPPEDADDTQAERIRVGMKTKQDLFREQKLSPLEINFLASLSTELRLAAGEILFREGDHGDTLYVVLEGRVRISKRIPGAGEEALAIVERGDYFGEMALIDNQPRSADAKAHDEGAVVLAIPRQVLEGILDIHKVSSIRLLELLCRLIAQRLREIDDKLVGWFIFAGGSGQSLEAPP